MCLSQLLLQYGNKEYKVASSIPSNTQHKNSLSSVE